MKKELIMIFGLFFILISLGFASAQTCYTTTYNSCVGNEDNVIMRFSDTTNAHGETTATYNSVLCCDFGSGSTTCTGNNAIIRLSATGNAHAEAPELVTNYYTQFACYDNLINCRDTTSNCAIDEVEVVYLSDLTNAHLSASGYSTRICCGFVPYDEGDCILTSATWSESEVFEGTQVNLFLTGDENCPDTNINFSIYEWDGTHRYSMTGTFPSISWITERFGGASDYEERTYDFTATVIGAGESTATSSNLTVLPNIDCGLYPFCESYDSESLCNADPCISASDPNLCACEWNATSSVCEDVCPVVDDETGLGVGVCVTSNYNITTDCEEGLGYLTYNWTSTWNWDEVNCPEGSACRSNPDNIAKANACRSGSKTIECPAQILLPFFGIYSMIISVLAIALVYAVMGILKKKKIQIRFK